MPDRSAKLMSLLFIIGRQMKEEMRENAGKNGCSWLHFEVLRYVGSGNRTLMRDVAGHFSITPPAATLLIDGLASAGLLRRIVDPDDRRAIRVALTPKARQLIRRSMDQRMKTIRKLFSILDKEEYGEFVKILEKLANAKQPDAKRTRRQ
jgi:DNA-binding MarR family transcriptional regulator